MSSDMKTVPIDFHRHSLTIYRDQTADVSTVNHGIKKALDSSSVWVKTIKDGLHCLYFSGNNIISTDAKKLVFSTCAYFYERGMQGSRSP